LLNSVEIDCSVVRDLVVSLWDWEMLLLKDDFVIFKKRNFCDYLHEEDEDFLDDIADGEIEVGD